MRTTFRRALTATAALSLTLMACTGDDDDADTTSAPEETGGDDTSAATEPAETTGGTEGTAGPATTGGAGSTAPGDTVEVVQGQDLLFHMITHGDGGVFWSVVQTGAEQAGEDLGINARCKCSIRSSHTH